MKESGGGATLIKVAPPGPDPPKVSPLQYRKTFIFKKHNFRSQHLYFKARIFTITIGLSVGRLYATLWANLLCNQILIC